LYKKVLLAYDGTVDGRRALREGALLAKTCGAQVYLLSVISGTGGLQIAESVVSGPMARCADDYRAILQEGVDGLTQLGFDPVAKLVRGEPVREIAAFARKIGADLVVVGHRKQSLLSRWWSGTTGAYLVDQLACSVLIARTVITDEAFNQALGKLNETAH
jgi:nucleotide-binding universal stress UspA family protein